MKVRYHYPAYHHITVVFQLKHCKASKLLTKFDQGFEAPHQVWPENAHMSLNLLVPTDSSRNMDESLIGLAMSSELYKYSGHTVLDSLTVQ